MKTLSIAAILIATSISANAGDLTQQVPDPTVPVATIEGVEVKLSDVNTAIVTPTYPPAISYEKAREIALEAVKQSLQVVGTTLAVKEGESFVYKIEVYASGVITEVEVDAATGNTSQIDTSQNE
jgi:uncharacterized membrane protein YkoI